MDRNTYAVAAVLVSVAALALLSLPATDAFSSQDTVTSHPQGSAGDPERLDGDFAGVHDLVEYGQIGYMHSDPAYRNVMVVVAKYDEKGLDVSEKNKEIVVKMLRGIGARDINAAEMLSFVIASVPADRILDVSGHDLVYRVDYDGALAYPMIDKMRVTVGATADNLRRYNGTTADGSGVTVGIVDRGINQPQGINDRVVDRTMCDDLRCYPASAEDVVESHGTLVALVVAGSGFPAHNGIAPGVDILDAWLSGNWLGLGDYSISNAFSWLLRNDADVANLSVGFGQCRQSSPDTVRQLIMGEAVDNGMVVVTTTGNSGVSGNLQNRVPVYQSISEWGCTHNVITVGGIDDRDPDNIKMFDPSGRGPATHRVNGITYPILKPEIVAPAILQIPWHTANNATALARGTSFAAPAVTAVVALALQERDMEPAAVKAAILLGANWTGPVPCTSVQYEQNNATDSCSHGRQPDNFNEANNSDSLEIVNNVGFGILNAAKTLDYISQASGRHLVEDSLESDADINGYRFEVTDAGDPVKIILSWTTDLFYEGLFSRPGTGYFADLGFTVDCPGMETVSAQSAYQANEFAVFVPAETGMCTVGVTGSDIDTPRRSQQDYAIASTLPLDTVDIAAPRPVISTAEPSTSNAYSVTFTVDFGEPVNRTTFTASDVSVSGGTVSDPLPADSTNGTFTFKISDIRAGNLTVSIPEDGVLDLAGNGNIASNPYVIEIERTRPTPALSTTASSPVNASSITFTVDFGEQVDTATFTPSDVSASSGTVSDPLPAGGNNTEFTFVVSDLAAGNLTVFIPEGGVLDPAGNGNTASDPYVVEIKRPRPLPVISAAESFLTNAHSITFTVNFGVPVDTTTFTASDISTSAGTVSDLLPANSIYTEFTFEASGLTAGNLTVFIPEGGVLDPTGNGNTASNLYVIEIEHTRPAPALSTTVSSPVSASSITFTVDFDEPVVADTFTASDVSASGGTVSDPLPAGGNNTEFTFEVSDLAAGNLTVFIPEGGVLDPAGNGNTASDPLTLTVTNIPAGTTPEAAFVTTWQTTSANEFILIPVGESTGTYTVNWGDASIDTDVSGHQMHTYKNAGTYTVSIYGDFSQIYLPYYLENALKMQSIEQWGDIRWESMRGAFSGALNMVSRATDAPDLSAVTDTSEMFRFASSFNGSISTWDVSQVTDMRGMFEIASAFNSDISSWNVSGVTDMSHMFGGARIFAQNLGDWYIVLDETTISDANTMLAISAQNAYLDGQNPVYTIDLIAPGGDKFRIVNGSHLAVRADQTVAPGQYNVTIKSIGSFGTDNSKIVGITVSEDVILQTNSPPSVEAGPAQTVQEGSEVSLNGSATDPDEDAMTYLWTHNSTAPDIALASATSTSTTFTAPQVDFDTAIAFTLTANDGTTQVSDRIIITITDSVNTAPTVNAGTDQEITEGDTVTLAGTATDADPEDDLTHVWSHDSTLFISLDDSALTPSFTVPNVSEETAVEFTLTVSDGTTQVSDRIIITITDSVNTAPTVNAGTDQEITEGDTVTLAGTATDADPEDDLTHVWSHDSTLFISLDDSALTPSFTVPNVSEETAVEFTLTVSDGTTQVSDRIIITITDSVNTAPTVNAGTDQEITEGDTVTLAGTATDADPEDDLTHVWSHDSTLFISLDDSALTPSFTVPNVSEETAVEFTLTVSDGTTQVSDRIIITITDSVNTAPTVNAGTDQEITEGDTVTLAGTATDADPEDDLTHVWSHDSTLFISLDDSALTPSFTVPNVSEETAVEFTLTVSDGTTQVSDRIIITITDSVNTAQTADAGAFITTWQTGAAGESITIPVGGATGTYTVDWGDGNTSVNVTGDQTHVYEDAGTYVVRISGDFTRIYLNEDPSNADKLVSIEQWGDTRWESMISAFHGASNMVYRATDVPVLSDVTSMRYMFYDASSFDGNLSGWDVSSVTDMSGMFNSASSFNQPLNGWDVSKVTDMSGMFAFTSVFNQLLNSWNVSSVSNMSDMFNSASSFNQPLNSWDVSSVTDMSDMFNSAFSFNGDLSSWDVSSVTDMASMFFYTSDFDGDLSGWDVSSVTDMAGMFNSASSFNGDLSSWNISSVNNMSYMFSYSSFNGDLSGWDVSGVTYMEQMFQSASFNGNLGNWYITLDNASVTGILQAVGNITPQNEFLATHEPTYGIGSSSDSEHFGINGAALVLMTIPDANPAIVNITSTGDFGTSNSRIFEITILPGVADTTNPRLASIERSSPTSQNTDSQSLIYKVTFSESVTGVTSSDFILSLVGSNAGTGSITGISGSGSVYYVTVSAAQDGTYNLDLVSSGHGIRDAANNLLNNTTPTTGTDHTYTVSTTVIDTTNPRLASIERSSPAAENTDSQTLVYKVTFSENVTGVDTSDFTLSPGSTGNGTGSGQFTQTRTPAITIPYDQIVTDTILVTGSGTATSVSVAVDIAHQYVVDLKVDLIAPDGTVQTLHDHSSGPANIDQTYTPDFGSVSIAGNWTLQMHDDYSEDDGILNSWMLTVNHDSDIATHVTSISGSGSVYYVTVSATQDGTYNLDLVSSDHNIADAANNSLTNTATTGADQTYTVSTAVIDDTAPTLASIERYTPATENTDNQTLVYKATFSEDVMGVTVSDFTLSSDSAGGESTSTSTGQFTQTRSPHLTIPDLATVSDIITVSSSGTVASVSVEVDITHNYIGDLKIDIIAPDGTSITLHDNSGGSTVNIDQPYAPLFGSIPISGVWTLQIHDNYDADPGVLNSWTLTINYGDTATTVSSVTDISGSGDVYYVTVSATQDGTYNLDLVSSDHNIVDAANNSLTNTATTGADQTYTVSTAVIDNTNPRLASIERYSPTSQNTDSQTLVYKATFSEDVMGVTASDFVLSPSSTGRVSGTTQVTGITGSGDTYYVTVSSSTDGTYNLDLVSSDHNIVDAASNSLTNTATTGADQTYTVSTAVIDDTAPTLASIERYTPATENTDNQTLVYKATFSEDVMGVTVSDFTLSSDSAGGESTSTSTGQFTQTRSPHLTIPDLATVSDIITVSSSGTVASVSVEVDITHNYIGDLKIDIIAPDGTSITLHDNSGGSTVNIDQPYAPLFGSIPISGVWTLQIHDRDAPDPGVLNSWTLTINYSTTTTVSPVTGISGSGDVYYVTVSATQDGTYNLDLVSSDHNIVDAANNSLTNTATTGADQTYTVSTAVIDNTNPRLASIERYSPTSQNTDSQTLVYKATFSEDVMGVTASDFVLSPSSTGRVSGTTQVTGISGSGDVYYVTVSATQDGTYNLDLVSSGHNIADAASNSLTNTATTGADQTYTVSTAVIDDTAPTLASIERYSPATENTDNQTLVYKATFSEDVMGVTVSDFTLSSDSAGGESTSTSTGQFTQTRSPHLTIPDLATVSDIITVSSSGTVASVSVEVDITHNYIGDLKIDIIAPDGTSITLHDNSGGSTVNIDQPYAPLFGSIPISGVWTLQIHDNYDADPGVLNSWTLTINYGDTATTVSSVTDISGSGDVYYVTVSATQDGTYNLDLVSSDHNIADAANNSLTNTATTGADQTYTVSTAVIDDTAPTLASIERYTPATENTDNQTLVYKATFSEDVMGVTVSDFTLSSDSAGGESTSTSTGQFTQTRSPHLTIPDLATVSDIITVSSSGTVASVSVEVDITHNYIGDLKIDIIAPDGTSITLHDNSGGSTVNIDQPYAPLFGSIPISGVWTLQIHDNYDADPGVLNSWTLTINYGDTATTVSSVTDISGSGDVYYVTVSATQDGTYNLDLVSSDHNIVDAANNSLTNTATTGADQTYTVSTAVIDNTNPRLASIERYSPTSQNTDSQTLVYKATFSEDVMGVTASDFVLSPSSTGRVSGTTQVTGITGSGDTYYVTVSSSTDGTYNLDLVSSDHNIVDAANNSLTNTATTGADQTYTVSTAVIDDTAPTLASIERYTPATENTDNQTLVYKATFSEDVMGVTVSDFTLSSDSAGGESTSTSTGQFTQTRSPHLTIPDLATVSDIITVSSSGTVASVSVEVDITHNYIGDLKIDIIAPDGTSITLHDNSGGSTVNIDQPYAPLFGSIPISGVWTLQIHDRDAPDPGVLNSWTLTINYGDTATTVSPVTDISGSGDVYYVTVSATQDGTYNLDLVSSDHNIVDAANNSLTNTATTGADQTYTVSTAVIDNTNPRLASIERYSPTSQNTDSQTLVYKATFSEDVMGVTASDFVLSPSSTGRVSGTTQVTGITGSGDTYYVTVSSSTDGTYNLDLVSSDHNIVDAANNSLTNTATTGADQTYTVSTAVIDDTAPTLASIERYTPATENTDNQTLVYKATFSEDVMGVTVSDFTLSSDSAGGESTSTSTGQFTQTRSPHLTIPDLATVSDIITVSSSGTVASVSVEVDITHNYIGDLKIDIIAPDGTSITLHDNSGGSTVNIDQPYAPLFGSIPISGVWTLQIHDRDAPDPGVLNSWTLTINYSTTTTVSPVTGISGSGDVYYVTVSATQDGTYNLDLVSSDHNIVDAANNSLTNTATTGADQTYTVSTAVIDNTNPRLASIERYSPTSQNTDSQTLVYKATFSEDVMGVTASDFVLSPSSTGRVSGTTQVTGISGSGDVYYVTVSATQDGTYNLDLVSSGHNIADAASNSLTNTVPITGIDQTYTKI